MANEKQDKRKDMEVPDDWAKLSREEKRAWVEAALTEIAKPD